MKEIPRPQKHLIERFKEHDVAKISDSMGRYGTLKSNVKPLSDSMRLCGPAVTVNCSPGSTDAVLKAIRCAQAGDVIVANAEGITDLLHADMTVYEEMKKAGVAGLVLDGAITDKSVAIEKNIPVFAINSSLRRLQHSSDAEVNVRICCAGMVIDPGDLVIGDSDGVVIIPHSDTERVLALADAKLAKELYNRGQLETTGVSSRVYYKFDSKMDKWREPEQRIEG